jgi:divalent metal cation (Fe/Co/Zn/Cd) transporter
MLIKFFAYFLTHSNAILSDALESIINVVAGMFAYYSLYYAAKPKDVNHPYGHGKIEFISAGFEGGLIFIAGLLIIIKSISNLIHPSQIDNLDTGIMISGAAGLINFFMGRYLISIGTKQNSIILKADGKHLQADTFTSIGLMAGVAIIYFTGYLWLDSVLAIVFAFMMLNETRKPKWIDVHNLRVLQYGSSYHIDCHITMPWYENLSVTHDELKEIEKVFSKKFQGRVEVFIHPDPCVPESCRLCQITTCEVRNSPFEKKVDWTLQNIQGNAKHII